MLRYPSIYEQPHISGVDRVPAMDCRSFSKFLWFNEPKYDGLTQLVIPMDSWLGFFIYFIIGECRAKTLIKVSLLQKTENRVEHFCKTGLCKMFKVRQGSDATDRDGVQNNRDNKIFADYFFVGGKE